MSVKFVNREDGSERDATADDIERMARHLAVDLQTLYHRIGQGERICGSFSLLVPACPFSLSCYECDTDDGLEFDTAFQAVESGWHDVVQCDGGSYNFLGLCPECRKSELSDIN